MGKSILILSTLLLLVCCNPKEDCPEITQKEDAGDEKTVSTAAKCATSGDESADPLDPVPVDKEPTPEAPSNEVPTEAFSFDANFELFKFDQADEIKLAKATEIIKKVIRSNEFRQRILTFSYKKTGRFYDHGGLTNAQIYQALLDGSEVLQPGIDHEMDMELELYYKSNNTVGETNPRTKRVWMNTKYFDVYTPAQVARNVFHEWTHKLGFTHSTSNTASRDFSVPYGTGKIMEELGKQYE